MQMKIRKNETFNKKNKAFYTELLGLFSFLYHIQEFHQPINVLKEMKEKGNEGFVKIEIKMSLDLLLSNCTTDFSNLLRKVQIGDK